MSKPTTLLRAFSDGLDCGVPGGRTDDAARALGRRASDIVSLAASTAASSAAGLFDCAADTVIDDELVEDDDEIIDNDLQSPSTRDVHDRGDRQLPPPPQADDSDSDESNDAASVVAETANDLPMWTPVFDDLPPSTQASNHASNDGDAVNRTTASSLDDDELHVDILPEKSVDCIAFESGNNDGDDDEHSDHVPTHNNKKRRWVVLGAITLLVTAAIAAGVVVQQTLGRKATPSEQNELYTNTVIAGASSRAPVVGYFPTNAPMQGPVTDESVYLPTIFVDFLSPTTTQTPSPNSDAQPAEMVSPNETTTVVPGPSLPASFWEGTFSDEKLTDNPSMRPSSRPTPSAAPTRPSISRETAMPTWPTIIRSPSTGPSVSPSGTVPEPTEIATTPPIAPLPTSFAPTTSQPTPNPTASPTPKPSRAPSNQPTYQPTNQPTSKRPDPKPGRLLIELQTDEHGYETSWSLYSVGGTTGSQTTLVESVEENTYEPFEQEAFELTLAPGRYRFILRDAYGDGFCCNDGREGWYKISLDDRELIRGNYFKHEISYDILIGYDWDSTMSSRDREWLVAHNDRRKTWHERHGETYVPLLWSQELAADASRWANELLEDCDIHGIAHESDVPEGENLAKNKGSTSGGMGRLYPPENILRRWVDVEEDWGWPRNAHLTQALWRASRYVGCGDAARNYEDGSICRTQVCRYVRAGNCDMPNYDASAGDNWLEPMLKEHTFCGPDCPREGCFL